MNTPRNTSPDDCYQFGQCELRPAACELRVSGQPRRVEPLAFQLLLHLVQHAGRTVSKAELLDALWPDSQVMPGALARVVALARAAIDDGTPRIRTDHRLGYTFTGEVRILQKPAGLKASSVGAHRLALLPFDACEWTQLGLMALVGNALALGGQRLTTPALHEVLEVLREVPSDLADCKRIRMLCRRLDVQQVVRLRISQTPSGYQLDYEMLPSQPPWTGRLAAPDLAGLGEALTQQIRRRLWPSVPPEVSSCPARDPWGLQLFGRALQAEVQGQLPHAENLLQVVLDLEPDFGDARQCLSHIQSLRHAQRLQAGTGRDARVRP